MATVAALAEPPRLPLLERLVQSTGLAASTCALARNCRGASAKTPPPLSGSPAAKSTAARERIAGELARTGTEGPAARGVCDELSCGIGEPRIGAPLGGGAFAARSERTRAARATAFAERERRFAARVTVRSSQRGFWRTPPKGATDALSRL